MNTDGTKWTGYPSYDQIDGPGQWAASVQVQVAQHNTTRTKHERWSQLGRIETNRCTSAFGRGKYMIKVNCLIDDRGVIQANLMLALQLFPVGLYEFPTKIAVFWLCVIHSAFSHLHYWTVCGRRLHESSSSCWLGTYGLLLFLLVGISTLLTLVISCINLIFGCYFSLLIFPLVFMLRITECTFPVPPVK